MEGYQHITHGFGPVYDNNSRILILGSLPSVKSRESGFYYGHPQNRFWKIIAEITGSEVPRTTDEKKAMLLSAGIAVYDVIAECDIKGSSDASIKNVRPADLSGILRCCPGIKIYANGSTAAKLYSKFLLKETGIPVIKLPSTSPANAAWSLERLTAEWRSLIEI